MSIELSSQYLIKSIVLFGVSTMVTLSNLKLCCILHNGQSHFAFGGNAISLNGLAQNLFTQPVVPVVELAYIA